MEVRVSCEQHGIDVHGDFIFDHHCGNCADYSMDDVIEPPEFGQPADDPLGVY